MEHAVHKGCSWQPAVSQQVRQPATRDTGREQARGCDLFVGSRRKRLTKAVQMQYRDSQMDGLIRPTAAKLPFWIHSSSVK